MGSRGIGAVTPEGGLGGQVRDQRLDRQGGARGPLDHLRGGEEAVTAP